MPALRLPLDDVAVHGDLFDRVHTQPPLGVPTGHVHALHSRVVTQRLGSNLVAPARLERGRVPRFVTQMTKLEAAIDVTGELGATTGGGGVSTERRPGVGKGETGSTRTVAPGTGSASLEGTVHIALDDPLVNREHRRGRLMGDGRYTLARSSMDQTLRCLLGEDVRRRFTERHRPGARSSRPMGA
jgi:hypothetical protein